MTTNIGTRPQDIPLNQFLGEMAFMDAKPKVAFQASVSSNIAHAAGTNILPYDLIIFDIGSNYNTSTYTFTAPVPGLYFFHLNLNLYNAPGRMMAGIYQGGSISRYHYGTRISATISGDNNVNASAILMLQQGDVVQPYSSSQENSAFLSNGPSWNRFEGCLL